MKRTASARKSSSARGASTRSRRPVAKQRRFAVCVQNKGYEASLERNKIYTVLPDEDAERDGHMSSSSRRWQSGKALRQGRVSRENLVAERAP